MKSRIGLCFAGLLMASTPGCCVFEALFGCDHFRGPGYGDSVCDDAGCGHSKKCAKKCRKCRECLEEHGMAGMHGGYYPGDMIYGDFGGGDCGCGGGGMPASFPGGGCAGCAGGGFDASVMTTPMMTVPTPSPTPMPQGGTALPPPIPPAETSSVPQAPAGTQYVSVEEFQRLPGVVLSGPASQSAAGQLPDVQALASNPTAATPIAAAPTAAATPTAAAATDVFAPLDAAVLSTAPSAVRQVQQAAWAPVRK